MDGLTESAGTAGSASLDEGLAGVLSRFARAMKRRMCVHDLRRLGIDEDDVEQEVRIRLWTALEREPARDMPAAYIQKVVLSVVIDAVRRERHRRLEVVAEFDAIEATCADVGRQPDAVMMQAQLSRELQDCLVSLPPRRRRPVQLHLLGYSMQEVSDVTGLTIASSTKLVQRGLADLRDMIVGRAHER